MPLEIESPVRTAVNARSQVNQVRRGRSENQLSTESDFYDQLLRFQTPDVGRPAQTAPEPTSESSLDSNAGPELAEKEPEETRDSESNEASDAESQTPSPTVVAAQGDRTLEKVLTEEPQKNKGNDQELRTAEDTEDRDSSNRGNEDIAITTREDANKRKDVGRNAKNTRLDEAQRRKTEVAASSNRNSDSNKKEVTPQEAKHAEALRPAEAPVAFQAEEQPDQNKNSQPAILAEPSAKRTQTTETKPLANESLRQLQGSPRVAEKKRPNTEHDANAKANTTAPSTSVQAPGAAREFNKQEKTNAKRAEPIVENPTPQAPESSRGKRRTDRNASRRAGGNNDGPQESADRPTTADRAINSRGEATSATTSREIAASQLADNMGEMGSPNAAAVGSSASSASPTTGLAPAATPAFLASSPTTASTDTSSAKGVSRSDPNLQGTPAVASSPASAPESSSSRSAPPTAGSSGPRLTQYQETKLVQRVLRGMEQLSNGGGQVRLRLHPPELGSLQMSLRIEGNTVFADMKVETTSARDALMRNLPVLKERLAEQGIQVEHFDVRTDGGLNTGSGGGNFSTSSQSSQSGNDSYSGRQTSRYVSELQNQLPSQEVGGVTDTSRRWTRSLGQLDFEA